MQVVIESIDQKLLLNGSSEPVTSVSIKLPDGSTIPAFVQPEHAERLMRVAMEQGHWQPSPQPQSNGHVQPEQPSSDIEVYSAETAEREQAEQEVEWSKLPDEHLSPQMKKTMSELGVRPVMPASELVAVVDQITERLMETRQNQTPRVQRLQPVRPRTVQKDDMGYPIVRQQVERDPGEVAVTGRDEDGVQQL